MTLPELALRFILESPDVSTIIPGCESGARRGQHGASGREPLPAELMAELRGHRWERQDGFE
jgi:aryl-alcohol dehydrogenase-like predicted oxidoreductase